MKTLLSVALLGLTIVNAVDVLPDCQNNGLALPIADNCEKYYLCVNGEKFTIDCPSGLHFNVDQQKCVTPTKAGCNQQKPDCTNVHDGISFPNVENCGKYYLCKNQMAYSANCEPGLHYSVTHRHCMAPEHAKCAAKPVYRYYNWRYNWL